MHRLASLIAASCLALPAFAEGVDTPGADAPATDTPAADALAATTDPQKKIYRVAGVLNTGSPNNGIATTFVCTSYSGVDEILRIKIRDASGAVVVNVLDFAQPRSTRVLSTHATALSTEILLSAPSGLQGSAEIYATTDKLVCTAMLVDASSLVPAGIALHMVRLRARKNTME